MPLPHVENAIPVLAVRTLAASVAFYREFLEFTIEWGGEEGSFIGSVGRGGGSIMLREDATPTPATVWIGVEDIVPFVKRARTMELEFVQEPTNRPWAYEFIVRDPDGNLLWLGSDSLGEAI